MCSKTLTAYNNSKHRSIGMAPNQVNYDNETQVYLKLFGYPDIAPCIKYKFQVGDSVRIIKYKHVFDKGYLPNWTEEIFTIAKQVPHSQPVYHIKDYQDVPIEGTFYEAELQKVPKPAADATYVVEEVLKRKRQRGRDMHFVKWRGYPASMNSWVPAEDIIQL